MDEVRPLEADHGIRSGGAGRRPTNDARGSARSIARRETAVVTDARRTRPIGAAHRSLRAGDPLRRTARPPAGATPTTEDHARKKPRNALIRFKTGAKMTRPAQTSETPQTTALPGDGPEPDKSDALPVPQNRKWRRNPLINLETDSEMARRAQARETPQATAFASGVLPRFAIAARGGRRAAAFPLLRISAGEGDHAKHGGGGAGRRAPAWQLPGGRLDKVRGCRRRGPRPAASRRPEPRRHFRPGFEPFQGFVAPFSILRAKVWWKGKLTYMNRLNGRAGSLSAPSCEKRPPTRSPSPRDSTGAELRSGRSASWGRSAALGSG